VRNFMILSHTLQIISNNSFGTPGPVYTWSKRAASVRASHIPPDSLKLATPCP
jgi:hypothetical protein